MDINEKELEHFKIFECLKVCKIICSVEEFDKSSRRVRVKEIYLQRLIMWLKDGRTWESEKIYTEMFSMVKKNLFRTLPRYEAVCVDADEDLCDYFDPAWPHIGLVYEAFRHFLMSKNFDVLYAKQFIDKKFVIELFKLFDSPNLRERDEVQYFVCLIYENFEDLREVMRKEISDIILTVLYETHEHHGILQLLEVVRRTLRLCEPDSKKPYIEFLLKVLLPLFKLDIICLYSEALVSCLSDIILESPSSTATVMFRGVLKYWPKCDSNRELIFWEMLEALLQVVDCKAFMDIYEALIKRISDALTGTNLRSINAAVMMLLNNNFQTLVDGNPRRFYLQIVPLLLKLKLAESFKIELEMIVWIDEVLERVRTAYSSLYKECLREATKYVK